MQDRKETGVDISEQEEEEMIRSTERDEWVSIGNVDENRERWRAIAKAHIDPKRKRISIAIPEPDLLKLKARALEEGIPYQTLINSLIHKYVNGRLKG